MAGLCLKLPLAILSLQPLALPIGTPGAPFTLRSLRLCPLSVGRECIRVSARTCFMWRRCGRNFPTGSLGGMSGGCCSTRLYRLCSTITTLCRFTATHTLARRAQSTSRHSTAQIFLFNNVGQRLPWCLWRETSGQTRGAFSAVPSVRHSLRTGSENARGHAARPLASAYTRHFECEDLQSQSVACPRTRARGHSHAPRCRPGWTAGWSWQISKAWRRKTPQMKTLTRVPATAAAAQQAPATLMDTNSHAVLVVISTWSSVVAAAGSLQEVPSHLRHK